MTTSSTVARQQRFAGLCLVALAVTVIAAGGLFRPATWLDPPQSETFFPALTLMALALCGILIAAGVSTGPIAQDEATTHPARTAAMGLIVAGYAALLPIAGFTISTLALHLVIALALGYRRWISITAFAIGLTGLCWLVFIVLMDVQLKP